MSFDFPFVRLFGNFVITLICFTTAHPSSSFFFAGVRVAQLFIFLCCVVWFVCLRRVSRVPNVADVSGLSILDCPFGFFLTFTYAIFW
jgi:uncharacterized membrane protein